MMVARERLPAGGARAYQRSKGGVLVPDPSDRIRIPSRPKSGRRPLYLSLSPSSPATVALNPVAPAQLPADTVLALNWSRSTLGSATADLEDSHASVPFQAIGSNDQASVMKVVSASGHGFPKGMNQLLRILRPGTTYVTQNNYGFCQLGSSSAQWTCNVGESNYWRVYLRVDYQDSEGKIGCDTCLGAGDSHHPIQFPYNGNVIEPIQFYNSNDGTMQWEGFFGNGGSGNTYQMMLGAYEGNTSPTWHQGQHLPKATVLRIEWKISCLSATPTFDYAERIYDATNEASGGTASLLWSSASADSPANGTINNTVGNGWAAMSTFSPWNGNTTDALSMSIGENGGYHAYVNDQFFYWGGLMMRKGGWCGPFITAEQTF